MQISVHIYPMSKLVHTPAGSRESQIRVIEQGKLHAYRYYLPLREVVASYCKTRGKRLDHIVQQLNLSASAVTARRGANPVKDNRTAFDMFVSAFYPRISNFEESFLREEAKPGCAFEGVLLGGLPHFSAIHGLGEKRFVYLQASKWDEDDLKA